MFLAAKDAHDSLPQDDYLHLRTAALDGGIVVTYNRNDFLMATKDAFAANAPHAGLLILTHKLPRDPARIAKALQQWVKTRKENEGWPMQDFEVDFLSY